MQPAANGWNLQRRRTRLSLSAWSRIVPPTHLSCNNLDRRSNQTNEATPCQSKTIQCCQQQTIGTKQSRNSKHFTRLCPLRPFLKPPFWKLLFKLLPILPGITWVCNFLLPPLCLKSQQASSQEEQERWIVEAWKDLEESCKKSPRHSFC